MSGKVIVLNRGSRRNLRQIRWKIRELGSLVLLAILILATAIVVMLYEVRHEHPYSDPPKHPQIRAAEPTD